MNREQFLLTKLAEECAEVAQMALKTQQFGVNECKPGQKATNKDRLHSELNDLNAIIKMLNDEFKFNYEPDDVAIEVKEHRVNEFYVYSKRLGKVQE